MSEPISAAIEVHVKGLQDELADYERWCLAEHQVEQDDLERLALFRQTISVFIRNIEGESEKWSGLLMNLKADRLAQENELYRKFVKRTNFLQVVLEGRRIVKEITIKERGSTSREQQGKGMRVQGNSMEIYSMRLKLPEV